MSNVVQLLAERERRLLANDVKSYHRWFCEEVPQAYQDAISDALIRMASIVAGDHLVSDMTGRERRSMDVILGEHRIFSQDLVTQYVNKYRREGTH